MLKLHITDYTEEYSIKKTFLKFIPIITSYKEWYLIAREPNGNETKHFLAKYELFHSKDGSRWGVLGSTDEKVTKLRMDTIQDIVNKYAKLGYHVPNSQIALFNKQSIDLLILEKKN